MSRFLSILIIAFATTATADTSMLFGPNGEALPAGNYRLLTVPSDATVMPTSTVLPIGGGVPYIPPVVPPVVPPVTPPVDPLTASIDAAIAAVTTDPEKALTAKTIGDGYKLAIGFAPTLKNADTFRQLIQIGTDMGLKQAGKAEAWKPYTDAMATLTATMTMQELVNCYTVASARLGGSVVPPVVPPVTPPTTKVDRVTYIYEKDENPIPPAVAATLYKLNKGGEIIAAAHEVDATDGDGDTPDQFKIAIKAAKKYGIPCLVVQAGDTVKVVSKSPQTEQDVLEAVQ